VLSAKAQNLSLLELLQLSNKPDWESVNTYLVTKGWEYYNSKEGDNENYNTVTWSYEKSYYNDKAQGWFELYTYTGFPNKVSYQFHNKITYNTIKNTLATNGFKYIDTDIKDERVVSKYANAYFIILLSYIKNDKDDYSDASHTTYLVTVIKKAGVYDKDNGLKKTFDDYGNLESEYTLKDGKINGTAKAYFTNGQVKVVSNFVSGTKQGVSKEYDESGNLTAEYNYVNGEPNGIYKIFENGKLKMTGGLLNGEKNGLFKIYDDEGRIDKEYNMKLGLLDGAYTEYYYDEGKLLLKFTGFYTNDQKTGFWQTIKIKEKVTELIEFKTYVNDEKNGAFKEVSKDSIIFGTYKNGILDGPYKVYRSLTALLLGGLHGDTTNCPLVATGSYSEGLKNGYWKYYSWTKGLIKEGRYYNDLETGEWKYYFENFVDEKSKPLPYSGKLFLIENYENGKKSGKETRYAFLERKEVPCDTTGNSNVNPLDTCHVMNYQKIFQISYFKNGELYGPFEKKDSTGITILKGNFINGKKDGVWLESYVNKDIEDKSYYTFFRGNYSDGLETGIWDEFDNEDFIYTKYTYSEGKLNGKTTNYYRFKKPREEKYFEYNNFKRLDVYDTLGVNIVRSYEIIDETDYKLKCRKTEYYLDGKVSQIYTLSKSEAKPIDHNFFELIFAISTGNKSDGSSGYADGELKIYDNKEKLLIEGVFYKKDKIGVWKHYYYDINIYTEQAFNNNIGDVEKYFVVTTGQLFSGKFIQKYDDGKVKYEFKISEGLRDGKSKYYDENGNIVKTEKYEKGILQ
jgi:antitoxin component YwqK of YwqJK toxin-antitoxin module